MTVHLRSVGLGHVPDGAGHPFAVPTIAAMQGETLALDTPVTFLVGENGSGKSTLLEGIACAAGVPTAGAGSPASDPTLAAGRTLADRLRLTWSSRNHRGFFLRAEDFFAFARRLEETRAEMEAELAALQADTSLSERARGFAAQPFARELGDMRARYGEGLEKQSHGEQFLDFFRARFVPNGLHLLDEPEAPLSPARQLALLGMLKIMAEEEGAQFVIATHSPLLMAYPGARIYDFSGGEIAERAWAEVEHVRLTRAFLADPEVFLRHL